MDASFGGQATSIALDVYVLQVNIGTKQWELYGVSTLHFLNVACCHVARR